MSGPIADFYYITHGHMPLRMFRDTVYVSPADADVLVEYLRHARLVENGALIVDPMLRAGEMRLVMQCR